MKGDDRAYGFMTVEREQPGYNVEIQKFWAMRGVRHDGIQGLSRYAQDITKFMCMGAPSQKAF